MSAAYPDGTPANVGIVPRPQSSLTSSAAPRPQRLALVQFAPRKGDVDANLGVIGEAFEALAQDAEPLPDVIVFPEAALSGYFVEGAVREVAMPARDALERLAGMVQGMPERGRSVDVVVGFYEAADGKYYNSALYATVRPNVILRHVHRKLFLPTYGVFDEERFISRGRTIDAFDTAYGRAAVLICEDACHSLSTTVAALRGAQIIFIPSASPGRGLEDGEPANVRLWRDIMRVAGAEHGVFVAYAGLIGFEGGKGLTGASRLVGPFGDLRAEAPFDEPAILRVDAAFEDVAAARAALPMLGDLEANLAELTSMLEQTQRSTPVKP